MCRCEGWKIVSRFNYILFRFFFRLTKHFILILYPDAAIFSTPPTTFRLLRIFSTLFWFFLCFSSSSFFQFPLEWKSLEHYCNFFSSCSFPQKKISSSHLFNFILAFTPTFTFSHTIHIITQNGWIFYIFSIPAAIAITVQLLRNLWQAICCICDFKLVFEFYILRGAKKEICGISHLPCQTFHPFKYDDAIIVSGVFHRGFGRKGRR